MEEALSFFRAFEVWIYLLLALGGLIYARKFILAWQELREASFGLERESAQSRLNQSASILVLLLTMAVIVFILVYFVAPIVPSANLLPTPTLDLLATPTTTLPAGTGTPPADIAEIPFGTTYSEISPENGCIPGQIEITTPENGAQVGGVVEIIGTADIPNFGFYKFEIKRPDETIWLTIQAGNTIVRNDKLGDWDTSRLIPGEYQLGLVVIDNQAQAAPACVVLLRVVRVPETTLSP
jgi:hypothetical protein